MAEQNSQDKVLKKTLADLKVQEDRAVILEKTFDENDVKLSELEDLKAERLGAFGELFGVVRGTASEMGAQIKESIISGELQGRANTLTELAKSKALPSNEELEMLWFQLLQEMNAQGEVKHFMLWGEGRGREVPVPGHFQSHWPVQVSDHGGRRLSGRIRRGQGRRPCDARFPSHKERSSHIAPAFVTEGQSSLSRTERP